MGLLFLFKSYYFGIFASVMIQTRKERIEARSIKIRAYMDTLSKTYPHWNIDFLIDKTASKYHLSNRTIEAIIKHKGVYK